METRVVNKRVESYDVYIGRGSRFGNPFTHHTDTPTLAMCVVASREEAIAKYREWFNEQLNDPEFKAAVLQLRGKRLGCFCKPKSCHGDIIKEYLDKQ